MLENINILTKLYDLKKNIKDKEDVLLIQNLISKYNILNIDKNIICSKKDFASNSRFINKYISENILCNAEHETNYANNEKIHNDVDEFYKTSLYKDLVVQRMYLNKKSKARFLCTYRETLNIHTIETINKYFKL